MRAIPQRQPLFLGGSIGGVPSFDLNFARGDNAVTKYGFVFTRATSATYVNSTGLIATAASGELRYTYDPVTLSALGVLIEEARTNLAPNSTTFSGAGVAVYGTQSSPDGKSDAKKITEDSATTTHSGFMSNATATLSSGTTYTLSLFVKAGTASRVQITGVGAVFGTSQYANFGLTAAGSVLASSGVTATIQQLNGGWYRCAIAVAASASAAGNVSAVMINSDTATRAPSYAGDGTSSVYIWGAQIEVGAFPTSYIPTTGAAATRNADVLSLTGAAGRTNLIVGSAAPITQNVTVTAVPYTLSQTGSGTITLSGASTAGPLVGAGSLTFTPSAGTLTLTMSGSPAEVQLETGSTATTYIPTTSGPRTVENVASWFNGDAGTMYAEYRSNGVTSQTSNVFAFYDIGASGTNRILLYHSNAGKAQTQIDSQSSAQMTSSSSMTAVTTAGTRIQAALAYAKDDGAISAQGASATADTSLILPVGMYQCGIGRSNYATALFNGTISRIRYYPRRLPNATLQSLTT